MHRKSAGHIVPGPGFLTLAEELGLEWDDERTFVDEHVKRVFDHYAKGSRRKRS
ncbi:hypothetical protein [Bradyrhizobium yuanmingense]|uniref:hypothetical protein n=1 Tax=Bradyrhizobium yuanmingense TaxID=108015 RepID=UPI001CD3B41E|nr:hypothetical protein [Bradyrhizobium yuanmingense]MCA1529443.1 hypothetical protein [Bradyrhizobium yuanmingense]